MGSFAAWALGAVLALAALGAPSSALAAEDLTDSACRAPLTADLESAASTWKLAAGVRARVVSATRSGQGGSAAFPIGIVRLKPGVAQLAPMTSALPRVQAPDRYLRRDRVVAVTNADFFSSITSSRAFPRGTVVRDGEVVYFPGSGAPSLVVDERGQARAVHVVVDAHAVLGDDTVAIAAVNDPRAPANSSSLYTDAWRASVPSGPHAAVITSQDRVTRVVAAGKSVKVAKGESVIVLPAGRDIPEIGDRVTLSIVPRAKDGRPVTHATGHAGSIMRQGRIQAPCSAYERINRPRTTIAWDDDGVTWIIVAGAGRADGVDGVRMGGATKWQMADIARRLGATWAVSMDGGGSSALLVKAPRAPRRLDNSADAWLRPVPVAWAVLDAGRGGKLDSSTTEVVRRGQLLR